MVSHQGTSHSSSGEVSPRPSKPTTAGNKKKLLFLCQTLPFPPDGGVHIRSFHLFRMLSEEYDVHALCFFRRTTRSEQRQVDMSTDEMSHYGHTEAFPIPQETSRIRWIWDHLRSVLTWRAYTVYMYQSARFHARLKELIALHDYSIVHIDSLDLSYYLRSLKDRLVVVGHHNIESALLRRRAHAQDSRAVGAYIGLQSHLTRNEERECCPKVSLNITCSDIDSALLSKIAPGARVATIPNGVDTQAFEMEESGDDGIVFVGGYTWFPNRDGMRWFLESILPKVRMVSPDLKVTWIGRMPRDVGDELKTRFGVDVLGFVDDIRPHVQRAACMIVPLRVGGGTRLKILDGWAMGKAIVSTPIGCEGLDARHLDNIFIAESEGSFAEAIVRVTSDHELRAGLGHQARKTAVGQYDWNVVKSNLLREYSFLST